MHRFFVTVVQNISFVAFSLPTVCSNDWMQSVRVVTICSFFEEKTFKVRFHSEVFYLWMFCRLCRTVAYYSTVFKLSHNFPPITKSLVRLFLCSWPICVKVWMSVQTMFLYFLTASRKCGSGLKKMCNVQRNQIFEANRLDALEEKV